MLNPMPDQLPDIQKIGTYVLENREDIIVEWEHASRKEHPEAADEQRQSLRNSLPEFLTRFGEKLASGVNEVPRSFAVEHGIQRWEIGWDIGSLARDFMILRRTLIRRFQTALDIDLDDIMAISAAIDEAVAVSISAYVESRELELNKQNEALERKNYELKRFAHMVAHEIRNPLGLITLAASSLKRKLSGREDAAEQFDLISEGSGLIIEVVDNLVQYASAAGTEPPKTEKVRLNDLYDDAVDNLKYLIEASDAEVTRDELPIVSGNAVSLRSVFQNLIENALKYNGDEPPRIHIGAEEDDGYWSIQFRDEGIGISEEDQRQIFGFLARVNINPNVPGTGVGLALCRRVAEQHGGTIAVRSTPGEGSVFTLRIPKHPNATPIGHEPTSSPM